MTQETRRRIGGLAALLLLVGCASTGTLSRSAWTYGADSPELAVRGFLDAVAADDTGAMGDLFGTKDGPAEGHLGIVEVEQRMVFLRALLRHDSYRLRQANLAQLGPDRVRYLAMMTGTRKGDATVALVAVPAADGRWYVEQLDVDELTGTGLP
ncbi:MAG: hypothetical protein ACE5HF_04225 [Gemmatimonadota bacterium]